MLADWFDNEQPKHPDWHGTQVQTDLRRWADGMENLTTALAHLRTSCAEMLEMFGEVAPYSLDPRAIRARAAIEEAKAIGTE